MQQRTSLLLILLLTAALAACATSRPADRSASLSVVPNPEKRLHVLITRLRLSDAQADAVRPILEDEYKQKLALREKQAADPTWKNRQAEEDLEWAIIKRLSEHLTREQMNEYCNLLDEEAKQAGKTGTGAGGPGGPGGASGRVGGGMSGPGGGSGGPGGPGGGF